MIDEIVFRAAKSAAWPALETLFGDRGACGGCWCMAWRLTRKEWIAGKGEGNKRMLENLVISGRQPGVIGFDGDEPVAWCAVAPRSEYSFLSRSRVLKPVDDEPVWSISCLFIRKDHRRQGLSTRAIQAAVEFAAAHGARIVEGYPTASAKSQPDPFVWTGTPSAFAKAGFEEVARRSATRPIMRRVVAGGSAH